MKKLITLVLVAGLGLFALGCSETTTDTTPPPSGDTGTMPADPATDPDPAPPIDDTTPPTDDTTPPTDDTTPPVNP